MDADGESGGESAGESGGGCLLAAFGAIVAFAVWTSSQRTRLRLGGRFEGHWANPSAFLEIPLVVLAGALVPMVVWLGALRLLRGRQRQRMPRTAASLLAAALATGAIALLAGGLYAWWNPSALDL
ncbi:hypothetical protein [Streptomyces apocyni]|uniref:hypothetical protein n=1 Tax=Streptomyces apocyni TaxID=2654677 RepID=UPI0012EACCBB|nr:hypothetical protein [Streptomyces apocyni]